MSEGWKTWKTLVWWAQLTVAFSWSALIVGLWVAWTAGAMAETEPGSDGALGVVTLLTSGCCGVTWIVGLVPIALCFWLIRGPE